MHRTPKPMDMPATIGTIQWIEDVKPVQPNLLSISTQLGTSVEEELDELTRKYQ